MHHIKKLFKSKTNRHFWLEQAFYLSLSVAYFAAWIMQHLAI